MRTPDEIAVGEALPAQERRPTNVSVFLYAAALWTPHRIHYDVNQARAEGYKDVLVHGPLLGSYMLQTVTDWLGAAGRVTRFAYRNLAPAHPGDVLTAEAILAERAGRNLAFAVWIGREDARVAEGRVEVELYA